MKSSHSFSSRVSFLVAATVLGFGLLSLALGLGYLVLDDFAQRRGLPASIQAELAELDLHAALGSLSEEEAKRHDAIGDAYYIDPPLFAIAAAFAVPLLLMALAGASAAALLAQRLAEPVSVVARQARKLAEGDLSARAGTLAPKATVDEVARLVQDFDTLAAKLEAAEAALRRDAAAIAHELGTPLMVIRGTAQALLDGVYPADREHISRIARQADQLTRIVEDLRVLTLASAGRLPLMREVVDLLDVARDVGDDLVDRAQRVGMRLYVGGVSVSAVADPARIRQALMALAENALRYAGEGGEVRIETRLEQSSAVVCVFDRGPGVPELQAGSIFDPFVRGESSRSRETGGSGLGLAVVKAIADAHGGFVSIEPREGGGAAFSLRLPSARPDLE